MAERKMKEEYKVGGSNRQHILDKSVKFILSNNPAYGSQGHKHHFLLDQVVLKYIIAFYLLFVKAFYSNCKRTINWKGYIWFIS